VDFTSVMPWQVAFLIPVCSIFFFFLGRRSAARENDGGRTKLTC